MDEDDVVDEEDVLEGGRIGNKDEVGMVAGENE
jgi:hypothetical protein